MTPPEEDETEAEGDLPFCPDTLEQERLPPWSPETPADNGSEDDCA